MSGLRATGFTAYVALGDSMSIDLYPGPGIGAASLLHRNVDERFPEFAGRDLQTANPGLAFVHLARDGATTHDVQASLVSLPPQEGRVLFTLTVGGNDLLRGRLRHGISALQSYRENLARILDHIFDRYGGRCLLLLATIYDPTDGVGDIKGNGAPNPGLVRLLQQANEIVREAASSRQPVVVADVHAHFLGHGSHAGDVNNPHHRPENPTHWVKLGIEPNERGGSEVRRVFWDALNR